MGKRAIARVLLDRVAGLLATAASGATRSDYDASVCIEQVGAVLRRRLVRGCANSAPSRPLGLADRGDRLRC